MAKDPADRFSSAAAMAEAAEHAVSGAGDTTAILAATSARRASPGSGTAILPAVPVDEDRKRRRTPLLVAAAILALVVAGVALALVMNPGLLPGSGPPAVSESDTPSQNPSPGSTKRRPTDAPAGNAPRTTGPSKNTTPTPSATPSTAATTTAPEQTATTEPEQTEPTTDDGGGNSGPGGGGDDNSGNGGGDEDTDAATTTPAA
jgi:serine/threonine-protein kinase